MSGGGPATKDGEVVGLVTQPRRVPKEVRLFDDSKGVEDATVRPDERQAQWPDVESLPDAEKELLARQRAEIDGRIGVANP